MEPTPPEIRVSVHDLTAFCVACMRRAGLNEEDATLTAEVLVTTDTWGVFTHGSRQLRGLLKNFRQGRLKADAHEEVIAEAPAWALVDAHYAMPPAVSQRAMRLAIRKAKESGIAFVGILHSSHFGAAGFYAVMAAQQDAIGLSMCNVNPIMTVPGSRGRVLGTNPIAYAAPAGRERPIFFDIATSTVAATKVFQAAALGKPIPDNWLIDDEGMPTTDPTGYPLRGALLPMAGHKGYGLALLVEILAGVLTGAAITQQISSWVLESNEPTNEGHAFFVMDVAKLMPVATFKERMDGLIQEIRAAPKAKGAERIYLPGEMEWERRERALTLGIPLPLEVRNVLRGLSEDTGVALPFAL